MNEDVFKHFASAGDEKEPLLTGADFNRLAEAGFINWKKVRDFEIKNRFKEIRRTGLRAGTAIDKIRLEYPYLQFDTIRKIIYDGKNI